MPAKQTKKAHDLTLDLKHDEERGEPILPKEDLTPALASHLAERANLTPEQATSFLTALAETALEQLRDHPNRYFILPGIGAMRLHYSPPETKLNPFTNKSATVPARVRPKFHFSPVAVTAMTPQ